MKLLALVSALLLVPAHGAVNSSAADVVAAPPKFLASDDSTIKADSSKLISSDNTDNQVDSTPQLDTAAAMEQALTDIGLCLSR